MSNNSNLGVDENRLNELVNSLKSLNKAILPSKKILTKFALSGTENDVFNKIMKINMLRNDITNNIDDIIKFVNDTVKLYYQANNKIQNSVASLSDSSTFGVTSSTVSTTGSYYTSSTGSTVDNSSDISINNNEKNRNVNKVDVDAIVIDMLVPFGVTKAQFGGIVKSDANDYNYVVSINNTNSDGSWNANDIKEYYIKDGKVVGVLTGDGKYIKVQDGKLVLDKTDSNLFNNIVMSGVGVSGVYFATKTNYNNATTKAIFETVYPSATDDEYNNFVDSITKNGEKYENAAKNVIEKYKDSISADSTNNNENGIDDSINTNSNLIDNINNNEYLVIEDNAIKVNPKTLAAELYANASKLNNVKFTDGITSEVVLNESVATELASYLNTKYSMNVDVNTIMGNVSEVESTINTFTSTPDSV